MSRCIEFTNAYSVFSQWKVSLSILVFSLGRRLSSRTDVIDLQGTTDSKALYSRPMGNLDVYRSNLQQYRGQDSSALLAKVAELVGQQRLAVSASSQMGR